VFGSYVTLNNPHWVKEPLITKGGGLESGGGRHDEFPVEDGMTVKEFVTAPSVEPEALTMDAINVVPVGYGRKETQTPAFCTSESGICKDNGKVELKGMTFNVSERSSACISSNVTERGPHCSTAEMEKENEATCRVPKARTPRASATARTECILNVLKMQED
jgi:hypothetical protein